MGTPASDGEPVLLCRGMGWGAGDEGLLVEVGPCPLSR
jgi:hypothetical protein